MNIKKFTGVKGFMPFHEGEALTKWASLFSKNGPILEIGTYCGKSTLFLSEGSKKIINLFIQLIIILGLKSIK